MVLTDAPEVKSVSSCSSEVDMVNCACIADSRPPSTIRFVLSDRVLPSTTVEKHGSVTIGTLKAVLGSYDYVVCLANNTQGNANLTLFLPVNSKEEFQIFTIHNMCMTYCMPEDWCHELFTVCTGKMQTLYIIIGIGTGVIFLIPLVAVGVVKKW